MCSFLVKTAKMEYQKEVRLVVFKKRWLLYIPGVG